MIYDPSSLLVSIHIPKCAGVSLTAILGRWFGGDLLLHYPSTTVPFPEKASATTRCVHGHFFHNEASVQLNDYYPNAKQLITFVREPLSMVKSSYRFAISCGYPVPDTLDLYIEALCVLQQLPEYLHLPFDPRKPVSIGRHRRRFLFIGIVESFSKSIQQLANILGYKVPFVPRANVAVGEDIAVSATTRRLFENTFDPEYKFYYQCLRKSASYDG
jgi:hypothetical protein